MIWTYLAYTLEPNNNQTSCLTLNLSKLKLLTCTVTCTRAVTPLLTHGRPLQQKLCQTRILTISVCQISVPLELRGFTESECLNLRQAPLVPLLL